MKIIILLLCLSCTIEKASITKLREFKIQVDSNFTGELFGCLGYVKGLEINYDRWGLCCKTLKPAWVDHPNTVDYGKLMWKEACTEGK